jgi:hypothetical protein
VWLVGIRVAGVWFVRIRVAGVWVIWMQSAGIRVVRIRWAVGVWWVGVRWIVGRGTGGGRYVGKSAEQEAEEDLGAEQVDVAASAGGLQGAGESADPGHRSCGADAGQAVPGQRGGAFLVGIQADFGFPFRFESALVRAFGVSGDHSAAECGAELGSGLKPSGRQDP